MCMYCECMHVWMVSVSCCGWNACVCADVCEPQRNRKRWGWRGLQFKAKKLGIPPRAMGSPPGFPQEKRGASVGDRQVPSLELGTGGPEAMRG